MFYLKNSRIEFCGLPLGKLEDEPEFRIIPRFFAAAPGGAVEIGEAGAVGVKLTLQTIDFDFARAFDRGGKPLTRRNPYFRRFGRLLLRTEEGRNHCYFAVARLCKDSFWDKKNRKLVLMFEVRPASGGNYLQILS